MVVNHGFRFDADRIVHGCEKLGGVDGIFRWAAPRFVARSQHEAAFGSGAGHDGGVAIRPVVAAVGTVAVAGGADAFLRGTAKLANHDYERFVEQSARIHVREEGGQTVVEHGSRVVFHPVGEADMMIPRVFVGVRDLGPDDFDDSSAGFDEAASEQAALAEGVASVAIPHRVSFLVEVEGVPSAAGDDEVQGFLVVVVEVELFDGFLDFRHRFFDGAAEVSAALEAEAEDFGWEFEIFDLDSVHFTHVEIVAGGVQGVRIERFPEEACGAAFAHDVGLLKRAGEHDEREHGLLRRFEAHDVCAEVGEIFRVWGFELSGRAHLVGGVSGHDLVDGRRVVEETVWRVAHRADHGKLVVHLGKVRQDFRVVDSGDFGRDVFECAPDVIGDVFLGVPEVEVAWSTLEVDHDDALGLVPTCAARFVGFGVGFIAKHGR
ncbi:MAG: hypothetical protein RIS92_1465 [Verrucomicrobiota bacterium]